MSGQSLLSANGDSKVRRTSRSILRGRTLLPLDSSTPYAGEYVSSLEKPVLLEVFVWTRLSSGLEVFSWKSSFEYRFGNAGEGRRVDRVLSGSCWLWTRLRRSE